jgi:L-asparaginase
MAKVVVLGTGGTIASRRDAAGGGATSQASSAELVAALGERGYRLSAGVSLETEQFCTIGSYRFDLDIAFRIAQRVALHLADPTVAGVVVTQGTDTMEESAFMADLVVASDKPVAYTGAQHLADDPDSDGPRNLTGAIRFVAAPQSRGLGVVIAFDGEAHAARDATKIHASRVGAFSSGEHGKLADIDGDDIVVHRRPLLRRTFETEAIEPKVDLIRLAMGSDGRFIRCAIDTGAKAIVLEAFGRGNANHEVIAGIHDAVAADVPVIVTTRCPAGRVKPIYGDGGGRDVEAAGAIFAGDLQGAKARVLLSVLLRACEHADIAKEVYAFGG